MSEKKINTRITNKNDTEANWNKANNFIPKHGELIIYDADNNYDYPRVKIGDGETTVSLLPFFALGSDEVYIGTEEPTDENIKIWINPEDTADSYITEEQLNNKVDKEEGKGLSTNDYTTAEKNKLGALPTVTDDYYDIINADRYQINAMILNVGTDDNNGIALNPNGAVLKTNSVITLATDDFSQIATNEGNNLQGVINSLPTHDTENNTLDARKYNTIYCKSFTTELNGVEGVSINPNGIYTATNDFSTIYTTNGTTLQETLDNIAGDVGQDGVLATHSWDGTTLTITSASGTSSADLKGADGYTPVKGTDYFTEADKAEIVQMVIESLGGNPVFGYIDSDNNIIVSGNLDDGTYTLKYEMEDGTCTEVGSLVIGAEPDTPAYTNLLPLSVDADGNDFVGTHANGGDGYEYGYRISASTGEQSSK